MIYNNDDRDGTAADAVAERERIFAEQRARQAGDLLGGLLTTDKGKPWSKLSTAGAKYRANIELPDIN